ncbi:MAG: efflux RND transporter permease subunit [Prosthecobacter sp.]
MEKAIYWFSRNHVAANLLMLAVAVVGFSTWGKLKKEIFPETAVDVVLVSIPYPNASPEEVERGVCVPVEEAVEDVNGVDRIKSTASQGLGSVVIEVKSGFKVRDVMDDVKTRVDAITNFPEEAETPTLEELVLNAEVISVAVFAETDEGSLLELSNRLRDQLQSLPEITKVTLANSRPYEIGIEVSEETLRAYGLTFDQVANAVRASSLDLPAGSVRTDAGDVLVRTESRRYRPAEFADITVVTRQDGSRVKLGEIAKIVDGFEEIDIESRFNGKPAMLLRVFRTGNEDTLKVAEAVKNYITNVAPSVFPEGVSFEIWKDDSKYLQGRLDLLGRNAVLGFILVLVVLSLFLRPLLAFLVALGIPVSFMGALMLMPWLGVSINMISLFAFILVLGIVVDDAIVVGENVYERISRGEDPKTAAPAGTHEVGVIVIFGVLTTMMAFTPMLGLSGVSGRIWPNIPLVVIPTLAWSLLQSKFVLPSHLALLRRHNPARPTLSDKILGGVDRGLKAFVSGIYRPILDLAMRWRYVSTCVFIAILTLVVGLVGSGWIKFNFFPDVEADVIISRLSLANGVSFENTRAAVRKIEAASKKLNEEYREKYGTDVIRNTLASAGVQPFLNGFEALAGAPKGDHLGEVTIELIDGADRQMSGVEIASRWRELTGPITGALDLTFQTQGAAGGNAIDLQLTGNNIENLESAAETIKEALATYNGIIDISDNNRPGQRELKLSIKPAGEILGLRLSDVARQVRQAFYGDEAQRLQRGRDEVKVMVRYPEAERRSMHNLTEMKIRTAEGAEVPFSEVAEVAMGRSSSSIKRANRRRAVTVTADIDKTVPGANANEVVASLTTDVLPAIQQRYPGINWSFEGEQKDQRQSVGEIGQKALIALLGIYVLLAIPLRSYVQPFIVMSVIPFGLVGAVLGHMGMGLNLSIMSMCGVVALAGIVVNDSLVMVEFVNRERALGHSLREAALKAGVRRFRPILLTTVTTFVGIMPMALETDIQARFLIPMAVSLGFGILFATFITLFLVPVIYLIMEDVGSLARRLLGMAPAAAPESGTPQISL